MGLLWKKAKMYRHVALAGTLQRPGCHHRVVQGPKKADTSLCRDQVLLLCLGTRAQRPISMCAYIRETEPCEDLFRGTESPGPGYRRQQTVKGFILKTADRKEIWTCVPAGVNLIYSLRNPVCQQG